MKELSKKIFLGMNGVGYGRTDLRVNAQGKVFFLEMNPNCGLFYPTTNPADAASADCILLHDPLKHSGFIDLIVRAAIERNKKKLVDNYQIRFHKRTGYGLHASRAFKEGETILQFEDCQHILVSKAKSATWTDSIRKHLFATYAHPISEELWVMPTIQPSPWHSINHSCDPSAVISADGLTVIARRDIKKGEPITLEYGTYRVENSAEFKCNCDSNRCRGVIRGTDYLLPQIEQTYKNHIAPYVLQKRQRAITKS
jgi:D-alanine-D-alanine ligase